MNMINMKKLIDNWVTRRKLEPLLNQIFFDNKPNDKMIFLPARYILMCREYYFVSYFS